MKLSCLDQKRHNIDFFVFTVPWVDTSMPLMAPAALKAVVEDQGYSCVAVDLNAEIKNLINKEDFEWKTDLLHFFYTSEINPGLDSFLVDLYSSIATQVCEVNPKFLGLSLFSTHSQTSTKWICYFVKKLNPNIKIVIGGAGCLSAFTGPSDFVSEMLKLGLIDYHIRGDAELSLIELLKGNIKYSGINDITWTELSNEQLDELSYPKYEDYDFSYYQEPFLSIVASRGCVRNCTFCDFISNWPNFRWRNGQRVFEEMIQQSTKYGIRHFKFQDSLTNGNLKEFRLLLTLLSKYNLENPDKSLQWSGFFIIRNSTATVDQDWLLLKQSGATNLVIGIENFNQHIRYAMNKKFDNQAIEDTLFYAKKYQIKLVLLNIVGYINETENDIEYIESWLESHIEYQDTVFLKWGSTLAILPNTHLYNHQQDLGIVLLQGNNHGHAWTSQNGQSTPAKRAAWSKRLIEKSQQLGYKVLTYDDTHFVLEILMKNDTIPYQFTH